MAKEEELFHIPDFEASNSVVWRLPGEAGSRRPKCHPFSAQVKLGGLPVFSWKALAHWMEESQTPNSVQR